jgi:hypothetical protein
VEYPIAWRWLATRLHPCHANVVSLRPGLGETYRDVLESAGGRFDAAVGNLDRVLSRVGDELAETIRAGQTAIRAGRLAFRQQRRPDRVRGPIGLVGYRASNSR